MLSQSLRGYSLILASASPRRAQFLKDLGLPFEVRIKQTDEHYPKDLKGAEIPLYIAQEKANAFSGEIAEKEILITADTLIWFEGKAIGKPKDYADARAKLSDFSGKTHEVITAVCLKGKEQQRAFYESTQVTFSTLTPEMIHYYLTHYQPFDKAGSYGIQEWIGAVGITQIKGSYNNVVGFPTQLFWEELTEMIASQTI